MTAESHQRCKLKFSQTILLTVHFRISNKDLLSRLKELSDELSTLNQDEADRASYQQVAQSLVDPKLLQSNSVGIQAYACCAIADILRIEAPNAPYSASQLSAAFGAFFQQLKKLGDPENPFYTQQCYLLRRLAEVRSAILVTDLPQAQSLSTEIFTIFLGPDNMQLGARLEPLMADILGEIVSELEVVPTSILKLILEKFRLLSDDASALTAGHRSNISNPGQRLAIGVCEANIDRMTRLLAQYVSEILYEGGNQSKGAAPQILTNLKSVHALCVQIWRYIPELLDAIMSLFNDELDADNQAIRCLAVDTIGQIVSLNNPGSASAGTPVNFFIKHKTTWLLWLKKVLDVAPDVRVRWVLQLKDVLVSNAPLTTEINSQLSKCLHKCLLDTDEKVRFAACSVIASTPFEKFTSSICSKDILVLLTRMTREKHTRVRNEVIHGLGKLYDGYFSATSGGLVVNYGSHCDQDVPELNNLFETAIPNLILGLVYLNDLAITAQMDICLFDYLIPVQNPHADERVERILRFFRSLDKKGRALFVAIGRRQVKMAEVVGKLAATMQEYNKACADPEKDVSDSDTRQVVEKLEKILEWLCVGFPESMNLYQCLERLYQLKRARFIHLLQVNVSVDSDYRTVMNSISEFLLKLSDPKSIRIADENGKINASDMVSTIKLVLLRSSFLFNNGSNVEQFYKFAQTQNPKYGTDAVELLRGISETCPGTLKPIAKELVASIVNEDTLQKNAHPYTLSFLQVLSNYYKSFPNAVPNSILFKKALGLLVFHGTPNQARSAMEIVCAYDYKDDMLDEILDAILPLSVDKPSLSGHLAALSSLFALYPAMIPERGQEITSFIIKQVFLRAQNTPSTADDDIDIENLDHDELQVNHLILNEKLISLQFLVDRISGMCQMTNFNIDTEKGRFLQQAEPVFKLLTSFITKGGEITAKGSRESSPETYKAALRLTAGTQLLRLAGIPQLENMITSAATLALGFLVCDLDDSVRRCFMTVLQKYLNEGMVSDLCVPLVFLGVMDPDAQRVNDTAMWIKSMVERYQQSDPQKIERCLPNLIHLLSHHQLFKQTNIDSDILLAYTFALRILSFYVNLVANPENISLLYYLASRVRQYRDVTHDDGFLNLYRVSEVAQIVVKGFAESKGFMILSWPSSIMLSENLFVGFTSSDDAQEILNRVFISDKMRADIHEQLTKSVVPSIRQSTNARVTRTTKAKLIPKPKRTAPANAKPRATPKAKGKAPITAELSAKAKRSALTKVKPNSKTLKSTSTKRARKPLEEVASQRSHRDEPVVKRPKRISRRVSPVKFDAESSQEDSSSDFDS